MSAYEDEQGDFMDDQIMDMGNQIQERDAAVEKIAETMQV